MKKKWKRRLLMLSCVILLLSYQYEHTYDPQYEILNEDDGAFASYSDGLIYIGDKYYLDHLDSLSEGDILVEDLRNKKSDPDLKVIDSYKVTDKDKRNEILEVLCEYEECYPSDWDRSIESMRLEWFAHNLSYDFDFARDRSTDVDLDNDDEEKYDNKILRRILKL